MASGRTDAAVATDAHPKRRRLPGVNIRPGAVKQARVESGLSLAQLGKGHVTAPAIYLIETGRTRPSLPTLEHIARRTGKPVEFFLAEPTAAADEAQGKLIALEAMVADGRNHEAVALGLALLDRAFSASRLGRIRFLLGQAYLGSAQPDHAATLLAEARAHFEAVNDGVMLAECIGAQAALANMTQSKDAVALAELALSVCRRLKPVPAPTEVRLLGILAGAHVANREWDRAVAAYEAAIEAGGSVFDLRRVARMYSALGTAYQEVGEGETAARYAMRSVVGDLDAARRHLDRSLELCDEADLESGRSQVLLSLCELSMQEGKVDQAHKLAEEALELAARLEEGASIAEAHVWLGRIADRRGAHDEVDRAFDDAITGFEAMGMRERLLQCHGLYAEILERRGELAKAYVHMREALQASRPGLLRREERQQRFSSA
ncbi:MAG: helix-turn-helix transcriptional regulator [Chloroflexi bacterium]|nr:MAG: helix-turn-helix transcriptional regulator [Chloroflexota bacterium]